MIEQAFTIAVLLGCLGYIAWLFTPAHKRRHGCGGWTENANALWAACYHRDRVAVEESLTGDVVAALCLECDDQLPASLAPVTWQPAMTPLQRALQPPSATQDEIITYAHSWGQVEPIRRIAVPRF